MANKEKIKKAGSQITLDRYFTSIFGIIIFNLVIIEVFPIVSSSSYTSVFNFVFISILFSVLILYFIKGKVTSNINRIMVPALSYVSIYFFNNNNNFNDFLYQFLALIIFYLFANLDWKKENLRILYIICSFIYFLIFLIVIYINTLGSSVNYLEFIANPNRLAVITYYLSYIIFTYISCYKEKNLKFTFWLFLLVTIAISFGTGSRATMLSFIAIIITQKIWTRITKNKLLYFSFFIILMSVLVSFMFIYPNLKIIIPNFDYLNTLIFDITGAEIYTGREYLWSFANTLVSKKPIFGYGASFILGEYLNTNLSVHNFYMQVLLQSGVIGLSLFIIFLFLIWMQFWKFKNRKIVKISAAYFIGILVLQQFEVVLLLSTIWLSFLGWLVIGIMVSYTKE